MKKRAALLFLLQYVIFGAVIAGNCNGKWIAYTPDLVSVLRNPAMGWVMYEEGWSFEGKRFHENNIYTPELFWQQMEETGAPSYSNILYIRILWKDLEPEEGKYAWEYNEKYKWYIQKARSHGVKLAFRIFFHGGVPDYVYQAGATHTTADDEGKVQPHYDNPVFLEKLEKFIKAFAREYDNADIVDFIDAYGLGKWGEGHGVTLDREENLPHVIEHVTGMYAKYFKNILTVMNLSVHDYKYTKPYVYDYLGFLPRRDGIGSFWYNDRERAWVQNELFPAKALIGESCYWFNDCSGNNSRHMPFKEDKRFNMDNFKEVFTVAVTDALESHSNTMDLRVPLQCRFWIEELPQQVQRFISLGGYRLYPSYIRLEQHDRRLSLMHAWKNHGVGILPNRHPNWNHKYQLSFALLNGDNEVEYLFCDEKVEPADWVKGPVYSYVSFLDIPSGLKGEYTLCVGITDKTKNNRPEIELAVSKDLKIGKWVKITSVTF